MPYHYHRLYSIICSFTIVMTDIDRVMIYGTVLIVHELMDPKQYHALMMKTKTKSKKGSDDHDHGNGAVSGEVRGEGGKDINNDLIW